MNRKRYKRSGGKVRLSVENHDENARGHEGVDNPSHPSRRILLWFRSILREVSLVKRLWRTNEKIRADYFVGVRTPENTWPVQSRKETQSALYLRFISTSRKCMNLFFFFLLFVCFHQSIRSSPIFVWQSCKSSSCLCQVFIAVNCQINGPQVDFRIDHCGERDWAVGSFIFKSMSSRST